MINKNYTRDQLKEILEDELFQNLLFHTADTNCSTSFTRNNKYLKNDLNDDDLDYIRINIRIKEGSEPSPCGYFTLVALYFLRGDLSKSIDYLEKFLEIYDKPVENNLIDFLTEYAFKASDYTNNFEEKGNIFIKAKYLSMTGKYHEAIPLLESLLGDINQEKEKECLYFLIVCHLEINQLDKAMEYFDHYLSLDPDGLYIYRLLGKHYSNIKDYDKAFNYYNKDKKHFYKRISKINNNEKTTFNYRGLISLCIKSGKIDKLIQELTEDLSLDPDNEILISYLAFCYHINMNCEKTFELIDKALSINPHYYYALSILALNYHYKESYNRAIYYFKESIKVQYQDIWVYERLGMTYIKIKDFDTAIRVFKFVTSIWSKNGYSYFALSKIYEHLGKVDLASKYFKKAMKFKPFYIDEYVIEQI